jgi:hypothetical protein
MSVQRVIDGLVARFCSEIVALVRAVADEQIATAAASRTAPATVRAEPSGSNAVARKRRRLRRPSTSPARAPAQQQMRGEPGVATAATPAAASSLAERLGVYVKAHAAYSARELADALGIRTVDVIEPLRVLVEAGSVHKRIEGGQARYYAEAPPLDESDEQDERPAVAHVLQETRRASVIRRAPPGP